MVHHVNIKLLVLRFLDGESEAIDGLYYHYHTRLWAFCRGILKSEDEIPDIIQEVFIRIWISRKNIKNPEAFESYLITIARNEIITRFRKRIRDSNYREFVVRSATAIEYHDHFSYELKDYLEKVRELVEKLPEKRRHIYKLSREEGYSVKEIARELDISVKTVEDHITHAVKFIRKNSSPDHT